ncbi:MAG: DMT family transporter [Hyphomicrobiales bacterium]|nr:DMT family transporter [Hyphomicrobiales bacterium]
MERWGNLETPLALAAWQLCLGGLALLPVAQHFEELPPVPSRLNLIGPGYLVLAGTALAYWFWTRGVMRLGADVTFLVLLSPLVATIPGTAFLDEIFTPVQFAGVALILVSTATEIWMGRRRG